MRNHTEGNFAIHEARSNDQSWNDLDHPVIARREEAQIAIIGSNFSKIRDQLFETMQQNRALSPLAARYHDGFGIISNLNEAGSKAGLFVELIVVQSD